VTVRNGISENFDEISKLKNKRKVLEKQTLKMEKEMLKINEKFGKKTDKKPKEIDSTIDLLKQEHEKSKKIYMNYRGEKLQGKLSNFFTKTKKKQEKMVFCKLKNDFLREKSQISQVFFRKILS